MCDMTVTILLEKHAFCLFYFIDCSQILRNEIRFHILVQFIKQRKLQNNFEVEKAAIGFRVNKMATEKSTSVEFMKQQSEDLIDLIMIVNIQ